MTSRNTVCELVGICSSPCIVHSECLYVLCIVCVTICGVFAAQQPSAYISVWCVGAQIYLAYEQPDAFILVIEFTRSFMKLTVRSFAVITALFSALDAGSAPCRFHQNDRGTMIYLRPIILRGKSTAYIFLSSIRAYVVRAHGSRMHLCAGYSD